MNSRRLVFIILFSACCFKAYSQNNWKSLYEKGNQSFDDGQYESAIRTFEQAKIAAEKEFGKVHANYANTINALGYLYTQTGNYSMAEPTYLEALEIREKVYGKEHRLYVQSLNNLGALYEDIGNFAKAESYYNNAFLYTFAYLGKEHELYPVVENNLASLYVHQKKYEKAEELFLEVLEIQEKKSGKKNPHYAQVLNNLGVMYIAMGNYEKAEPRLLEAWDIQTQLFGKEHVNYIHSLNNLATFYSDMGNYPKAETFFEEGLKTGERILGKEHPDYANMLNGLATLYYRMGFNTKAEPFFLESISIKQKSILNLFPSLSEKEKEAFFQSNKLYFSNFVTFCLERYLENPTILSDLYNLRLSTKGILFNSSGKIRDHILGSKNKMLINTYLEWKSKRNYLAKVYQMSAEEKSKNNIIEKNLEEEANQLEKKLSQQSELFSDPATNVPNTWKDVKAKLKVGEAAVEIIQATMKVNDTYQTVYVALLVTPRTTNNPDVIILKNGEDLEGKRITYYRNTIRGKIEDEISYAQFWKPIAEKLKGITKVYFSSDGVYSQINLGTLYNPTTKKYLIDEIDIQLVNSTKDLLAKNLTNKKSLKSASLFGFPDYKKIDSTRTDSTRGISFTNAAELKADTVQRFFNGNSITELPGTKKEVETIEALLMNKKVVPDKYLYEKATETEIKKLKNPQLLHIATHGFFMADLPNSNPGNRDFEGMEINKLSKNPLLRSGLLFAGANQAFTSNSSSIRGEDGVLSAYEAMNLNLDQTELVILSACETGLGVTTNGEGVYGLQRAFQVAGAKSVLMSLWAVSDKSTQQLMTLFYEYWLSGKAPREAFKMAQLSLRKNYPEPFYWGAFVMVGE